MNKSKKGITLIALVITIIVLLILAGISITMLSGENSILNKAEVARRNTLTAEVYERLQIETSAHLVDSSTGNTSLSLIDFLKGKEYVKTIDGADLVWQVNVEKLLGSKRAIGNGIATGIDKTQYKDVYIIEPKNTNAGILKNTKIASTNPIKIADVLSAENEEYEVTYYDSLATSFKLGTLISKNTNSSKTDLEVLQEYFSSLEELSDAVESESENGVVLKPVNGKNLYYIGNSSSHRVFEYNNEKYVLLGIGNECEVIKPNKVQNGDLEEYFKQSYYIFAIDDENR